MKKGLFVLVALATLLFVSCEKTNAPVQTEPSHKVQLKRPGVNGTGVYLRDFKVDMVKNSTGAVVFSRSTATFSNASTDVGGLMTLDPLYDNDTYTLKLYNLTGDTLIATNNLEFHDDGGLIISPLVIEPGLSYTVSGNTGSDFASGDQTIVEYFINILL